MTTAKITCHTDGTEVETIVTIDEDTRKRAIEMVREAFSILMRGVSPPGSSVTTPISRSGGGDGALASRGPARVR